MTFLKHSKKILGSLCAIACIAATPAFAQKSESLNGLLWKLQDKNANSQLHAITELGERGINATARSVDHLLPFINNKNKSLKLASIKTLGSIGQEAKRATPYLVHLLTDSEKSVRDSAAAALMRIGSKNGVSAVELYQANKIANTSITKAPPVLKGPKKKYIQETTKEASLRLKNELMNIQHSIGAGRIKAIEAWKAEVQQAKQSPESWKAWEEKLMNTAEKGRQEALKIDYSAIDILP